MRWLVLPVALLALFAAACGGDSGGPEQTEAPENPAETVERFLDLWDDRLYSDMYDLLSKDARATIDRTSFTERYAAIADEAKITAINYRLKPVIDGDPVEVPYSVNISTSFFGDIHQENSMALVRELTPGDAPAGGTPRPGTEGWRINWHPSLVFAELDDTALVHFFARVPRRGTIYDRNGVPMAVDADLPVVGIVPDIVVDKNATIGGLVNAGISEAEASAAVNTTLPSYYFIPVKTLPYGTPPEELAKFEALVELGVVVRDQTLRVYPYGSAAAHVLGYMTEVTAEQLAELKDQGFVAGDKIGAAGLEILYDDLLSGARGALLATVTPDGAIGERIAEKEAVPGKDIYLGIDINVQVKTEAELGDRVGSIVVMNPQDNSVLALASYPRFDPNAMYRGLTDEEANSLFNNPDLPFVNRALQLDYEPGSTFKVITSVAGLERGGFTREDRFHCVPEWTALGEAFKQKNWQDVDRGWLTIPEGLMASCNPVFFDIGKKLDETDPNILPEVTRAFGFGSETGIGLEEVPGLVPDAEWKDLNYNDFWYTGDTVNMSIGQGFLQATPIQIANMYSAIAYSGILKKPLLVKAIGEPGGAALQEQQAEEINPLPASQGTLEAIRYGLSLVTQNPSGTSYQVWVGSSVDAAGKSGTAEDIAQGRNHVFFVAYANIGAPSIVALAALETGESGSREAGPMVRHILEAYLGGALVSAQ